MPQGFRPHEGDPSSLLEEQKTGKITNIRFRPHEGDPSSLRNPGRIEKMDNWFPSPRRGPIFSTATGVYDSKKEVIVSVPTKGTHLLYQHILHLFTVFRGFRPHEGDPSSLQENTGRRNNESCVSVPTKGTHLLYITKR